MPNKKATTTAPKPLTLLEQVKAVVKKHIETADAILKDYSYGTEESFDVEMRACVENLETAFDEITEEEEYKTDAEKFADALKVLKNIDAVDFDTPAIINLLNDKEVEDEELLKLIGEEAIYAYSTNKGFSLINLQGNMDRQAKLEHFITTEIYPHLNDQQAFMFI